MPGLIQRVAALLLPWRCLVCGASGAGCDLCVDCHAGLPWQEHACPCCALPLPGAEARCGACLQDPPPQAGTQALLRYAAPVDRLLTRFKFHRGLAEGRLLVELMRRRWPTPPVPLDAIVALPLHRERLAARGYNQALELARPLARAWRLPLLPQALRRARATVAQTELDAQARRRNVRGAFVADPAQVGGRRLLLLDDVVTTGATVAEAAATLGAAGAAEVQVLALARVAAPPR